LGSISDLVLEDILLGIGPNEAVDGQFQALSPVTDGLGAYVYPFSEVPSGSLSPVSGQPWLLASSGGLGGPWIFSGSIRFDYVNELLLYVLPQWSNITLHADLRLYATLRLKLRYNLVDHKNPPTVSLINCVTSAGGNTLDVYSAASSSMLPKGIDEYISGAALSGVISQ
jgi:hypothetical protein